MIGDSLEHYFTNNSNLKSELRTILYEKKGFVFTFFSDLGVFSKNHLDYGSRLLIDNIIENENKITNILDVGCGYGLLGIVLGKIYNCPVTMSDVNKRCIHLSNMNIEKNKIMGQALLSDCYSNITGTYDLIVTNPPIKAGKKIVFNILDEAYKYLNKNGHLWFVMRKDHGAKSMLKLIENRYTCEIICKSKGFYVIKAKIR